MPLQAVSEITTEMLAARLHMDVEDDSDALELCLAAACDEIEPLVTAFTVAPIPRGLQLAILDLAAQRYERTNLTTAEKIGTIQNSYADEYAQLMERIAPWRVWAGL